jgi:hypothetical protein
MLDKMLDFNLHTANELAEEGLYFKMQSDDDENLENPLNSEKNLDSKKWVLS